MGNDKTPKYLEDRYKNLETLPEIKSSSGSNMMRNSVTGSFIKPEYYADLEKTGSSTYDSHMHNMKAFMI